MNGVRYPIADDGRGRAVHIEHTEPASTYRCFGCQKPLVAKRGQKRAWHFAHKAPASECADPDRALHETAKALISQGLTEAVSVGNEYSVGFACQGCHTPLSWNIAQPGTSAVLERCVVDRTRSDVVIGRPQKQPLIVEVVVSHDLDDDTKRRYEDSGIPVFVIHPTWDTAAELAGAVIADSVINVAATRCPSCRAAREQRLKEHRETQRWVASMLRNLRLRTSTPGDRLAVRHWRNDKFGREMRQPIRETVHNNAAALRLLGFTQSTKKPWLFIFQLPENHGVFFANLGSTPEVPIWEDTSALIHWQIKERSETRKTELVKRLLSICRASGADVRVSFYDLSYDQ